MMKNDGFSAAKVAVNDSSWIDQNQRKREFGLKV